VLVAQVPPFPGLENIMATYSLWGAAIPHIHKYFSFFTSKGWERQPKISAIDLL
jgi:hypothetical protein